MLFVSASYGNDSLALIQWLHARGYAPESHIIYADTGWARESWKLRVEIMECWARSLGFATHRTASEGFEALVRRKKGWPRQGIQFCTQHLKIEPVNTMQDAIDPERRGIVVIGKRRAESANRAQTPEFIESDPYNGGRRVWHPLYLHTDEDRDALLHEVGIPVLPHRSDECWPCINANKADIMRLAHDIPRVDFIRRLEVDLGYTSKGKPRLMYRPYRYRGAKGIDAMIRWAKTDRGADFDDGTGNDCQYGAAGCGT